MPTPPHVDTTTTVQPRDGGPGDAAATSNNPAAAVPLAGSPRPWTDVVPEYAGYPLRYLVHERREGRWRAFGGAALFSADTYDADLLRKVEHYATTSQRPLVVSAAHVAPDGGLVVTPNWPGGTWGGLCGATAWVVDRGGRARAAARTLRALDGSRGYLQSESGVDDRVTRTQAWWINGIRDESDGWDGFRVGCALPHRHEGSCRAGDIWTWDPQREVPVSATGSLAAS